MDVEFASRQLLRRYESSSEAIRAWGQQVARKYIQRVDILYAVKNLEELYQIRSLKFHKLTGEREGQYAIVLDHRWRLIVTYVEAESKIRIEEVTHHYGD